jgi:cytochrome c-type biogenesis protein CcmE
MQEPNADHLERQSRLGVVVVVVVGLGVVVVVVLVVIQSGSINKAWLFGYNESLSGN